MYCLGCGGAWFTETRQIIAPREPAAEIHQAVASRERYVYSCAECGLVLGSPGEAKKPRKKRKAA